MSFPKSVFHQKIQNFQNQHDNQFESTIWRSLLQDSRKARPKKSPVQNIAHRKVNTESVNDKNAIDLPNASHLFTDSYFHNQPSLLPVQRPKPQKLLMPTFLTFVSCNFLCKPSLPYSNFNPITVHQARLLPTNNLTIKKRFVPMEDAKKPTTIAITIVK